MRIHASTTQLSSPRLVDYSEMSYSDTPTPSHHEARSSSETAWCPLEVQYAGALPAVKHSIQTLARVQHLFPSGHLGTAHHIGLTEWSASQKPLKLLPESAEVSELTVH